MTMYRVTILDHPHVDWLVNVCGNGAVWCFERFSVVQFFEQTAPEIREAKVNGEVTGRGFLIPTSCAASLGVRYELTEPTTRWLRSSKSRSEAGVRAERTFLHYVDRGEFRPDFCRVVRPSTEAEDKYKGVDAWCVTSIGEMSGVQIKYDSPAEDSKSLWVQIETKPLYHSWSKSQMARKDDAVSGWF